MPRILQIYTAERERTDVSRLRATRKDKRAHRMMMVKIEMEDMIR